MVVYFFMIYDDTRVLALTVSIRMKVQYRIETATTNSQSVHTVTVLHSQSSYDRRIEGVFLGSSENTFLF